MRKRLNRSICQGGLAAVAGAMGVVLHATAADVTMVDIVRNDAGKFVFSEPDVTVTAGQTVGWAAKDAGVPHQLVADGENAAFKDTGEFDSTNPVGQQFDVPGVYGYVCAFHPSMKGTVTVVADGAEEAPAPEEPAPADPYKY